MNINPGFVEKILTRFIREELFKNGFSKGISGLSGGLDSSTSISLAVRALGPENVTGIIMPYGDLFPQDVKDAQNVAESLGIKTVTVDIKPTVDAYYSRFPTQNPGMKGNKMARERMSVLYDFSEREKALVVGTSNKTELLIGYGTIFGDMASAFNPLGDLYKTQVRVMARHLGVPESVITKTPTAGLWSGQTDEQEIGMSYEEIDLILFRMVDLRRSKEQVIQEGFERDNVEKISRMMASSEFKRKPPCIAKISQRTIGLDYLYPYDRGK
ncbi:MAG: NAD+ synthase [Candidatus Aminicenantaceae bacterium]